MSTQPSPGTRLKQLINGPKILPLHAVYDGFSCRLIEKFGYQAGFLSGAAMSEANLGKPDVGLMGMEENLTISRRLANSCGLTLLADCDTGYGNAVTVYHMTQQFEAAGVGGLMLEDQVWPKRCGHMKGKSVVSAEEYLEKLKAAVAARKDPDFVIKARTDSFATHGLDEAIKRLNLYTEAGADLLLADALATEDDIATVVKNVSKPLCVNMGFAIRKRSTTELISARRLEDLGVKVVMYGRMLSASALQGMTNALKALAETADLPKVKEREDLLYSFEQLNDLMGLPAINALEQRFVTKK